jgi:hypothetical protein
MPINTKPINFLTFTIHIPGFGRNLLAEKPMSNKGTLIPMLMINNERPPNKISFAWLIYKIAAAKGGATQGLNISAENKPRKKICMIFFLFILLRRL